MKILTAISGTNEHGQTPSNSLQSDTKQHYKASKKQSKSTAAQIRGEGGHRQGRKVAEELGGIEDA